MVFKRLNNLMHVCTNIRLVCQLIFTWRDADVSNLELNV